ncbi:MAG: hypothetical protein WC813_04370 [Patescibacteria group bacterium]|jgi:hypothetical protein
MSFPVAYFLIPFVILALIAGLFLFFNVYHILKFGIESTSTFALVTIYVIGFAFLLLISMLLLSGYNWNQQIDPAAILHLNNSPANNFGL